MSKETPQEYQEYYAPSTLKVIILSILSLGIYESYWFIKQWNMLKGVKNLKVNPVTRGIFSPIFAYSLFKQIKELSLGIGNSVGYSPVFLAIAFFVLIYSWKLPDPFWVVTFLSVLPLIPVNNAIKKYLQKTYPGAKAQTSITKGEIISVIVGILIGLAFFAIGFYFEVERINQLDKVALEAPSSSVVGNKYPEDNRSVFTDSCTKAGSSATNCECILSYFEKTYSFKDFAKIEEEYIRTNIEPPIFSEAIKACVPQ